MKELKITPPEGYEVDETKSTYTNIVFKEIILKVSAEQRMLEIWKSCNRIKYSSDDCRTYLKDDEPMFQQDFRNKKLYYRCKYVYNIFETEFKMSESQINALVISILSKDINCDTLGIVRGWKGGRWLILTK